jgi:ABC-type spermidine/putrescine transport systems, ATPase components
MAMDADNTIISIKGISKIFDKSFVAVDDFTLDIRKGEFVTLLGPWAAARQRPSA